MIKVVLKHFIYEKCLNVLFDGILNNFLVSENKEFNIGDCFKYIQTRGFDKPIIFYNCTIINTLQRSLLIEYAMGDSTIDTDINNKDYGKAVNWLVNIDYIEAYTRS